MRENDGNKKLGYIIIKEVKRDIREEKENCWMKSSKNRLKWKNLVKERMCGLRNRNILLKSIWEREMGIKYFINVKIWRI